MIVPGWYVDPAGEADLRFWDGSAWTTRVRTLAESPKRTPLLPAPLWWTAGVAVAALGVLLLVLLVVSTAGTGLRPSLGSTRSVASTLDPTVETTVTMPAPPASDAAPTSVPQP